VVCSSCGTANSDGARFCNECGTPLALACASCGHAYRPGQKFCENCGTPLSDAAPSPASPEIVPDLPPIASPEMRMVSVMFVDLVGFTSLSEQRQAEDVRELLGRYFDSTRTIIERHGGAVEKFIGDAVMAVWGVPVAREDDAERAVRTALEVVDAVTAFGEEVGAPDLRARAGVVTGQVAALENPGEGLVVGDRVNTASRVQSAAEPGLVYVDEVTRQATSAAIAYSNAGEHAVKGKAEPLRLWRAVRVLGGVGGADREQGLEGRFVGRDADLRLLKQLFHSALDRRSARLLAVSGDAGVGKSRLRREFYNYTDGLSHTVLWHLGRCLSHGEGVAYWALGEMVRQRLGIAEDASAQEATERLETGLERWVPDSSDRAFISPRLGALVGVAEPGLSREELFAGWRLFFERLADYEPVALVFEDLQWADVGLLDFIEQLLDWSSSSPIFILTLARPELAAGREGWPAGHRAATTIQLEPLDEASMRDLLDDLVETLPAAAADQIVGRAQGVPLYAIETLRALADRGVLTEHSGRLIMAGELGELDVPASLSSLLSARLDSLNQSERSLVKAMSVFGGSFPRSAAAALGDVPESDLDAVLATLVRKGVLVIRTDRLSPDRGQYAFAQDLLRTVAYEMLSRQERKPRHLAAAEYLRNSFPAAGEDVAEVIANHYLDALHAAAGDPDEEELRVRTLEALRLAGRRASTVGAPETAERIYRSAAGLAHDTAERAELTRSAGEMAAQAGSHESALDLFEEAYALFNTVGNERAAIQLTPLIGRMLLRGDLGAAARRMTDVLAGIEAEGLDPDVAAVSGVLGRALNFSGRYREATGYIDRALEIAQALKLPDVLGDALTEKGLVCLYTGRAEEARLLLLGAEEIGRRHGLAEVQHRAQTNISNLGLMWDADDAVAQGEAGVASARRRGDRYSESIVGGNLVSALILRGRLTEADHLLQELQEELADRPGAFYLRFRQMLLATLRGQPEAARAYLEVFLELVPEGDTEIDAMAKSGEVHTLLAEGRAGDALSIGLAALPGVIDTLSAASEPVRDMWPLTLDAAVRLGRPDDAQAVMQLLASQPPGHIPPFLEAQLARGRGLTQALAGRHDDVEASLSAAIAQFDLLGYPYWTAISQIDLAEWLVRQGRASEADPLLDEAAGTLRPLGARPALERIERLGRPEGAAV
jgi:class 3 adenylate cyclase/tetratricopeptide (TPR) repeat protein